MNGGYETMASFGPDIPADVLGWAEGLPTVHEDAHRFYVHAGFRPSRPGPDPSEHVRLWMREPFLSRDYDFGKPAWCMDQGWGRTAPNPVRGQATRTYFGRPRSCMRLSTSTATSTSVARRSSVCARNRSPITCFHLAMAASARARFVYPDALCQAIRPLSAMCWRWRSRSVGALSAVSLGTAVARGGTTTAASG